MKKMILSLILVLMSIVASTPASATTGNKNKVKELVPTNIIVKQTTQFTDGRTLVVYYKKLGQQCEVYSPCNEQDYAVADASKVKSTNFEVVDKVDGKLYRKATVGEVMKIVKRLVNQYL